MEYKKHQVLLPILDYEELMGRTNLSSDEVLKLSELATAWGIEKHYDDPAEPSTRHNVLMLLTRVPHWESLTDIEVYNDQHEVMKRYKLVEVTD
jgi:hypothetical protein